MCNAIFEVQAHRTGIQQRAHTFAYLLRRGTEAGFEIHGDGHIYHAHHAPHRGQ